MSIPVHKTVDDAKRALSACDDPDDWVELDIDILPELTIDDVREKMGFMVRNAEGYLDCEGGVFCRDGDVLSCEGSYLRDGEYWDEPISYIAWMETLKRAIDARNKERGDIECYRFERYENGHPDYIEASFSIRPIREPTLAACHQYALDVLDDIEAVPARVIAATTALTESVGIDNAALGSGGPKAFISYAREDHRRAKELYRWLNNAGISAWLDTENLYPGDEWRLVIEETLGSSEFAIPLLSKNSVAKIGFFQTELRHIRDRQEHHPQGTAFVIPVRIDDCEIPHALRDYHCLDMSSQWYAGCSRLSAAIRKHWASRNKGS